MRPSSPKRIFSCSLVLLTLLCFSSCGNAEKDSNNEKEKVPFPAFENFPEKQFENLALDQETERAIRLLETSGFVKRETSQANFYRSNDSTEIVLNVDRKLHSFKVFLRSSYYLEDPSRLVEFFGKSARSSSSSEDYHVYEFQTNQLRFKLNLFAQKEFLRMSFILIHRG